MNKPILRVDGISKTFPGQKALDDVHLEIRSGEVCALLGQNGSGKSTLIKILAGFHEADPGGTITCRGHTSSIHEKHGEGAEWRSHVRFIHQDLGLAETLGTLDNLALGRGFDTTRFGRIRWGREAERARALLAEFDMHFDLDVPVLELSGVERTMVAVTRALLDFEVEDGVLILDEPTASLPRPDVERLFAAIRRLTDRGAGVLFVSHRLDDVFELAQRVVVLREARVVAEREVAELDHDALIELIVGRSLDVLYPDLAAPTTEVLMEVRELSGRVLDDIQFNVRAGEIVGIAGLNGSGRDELAALLFGSDRPGSGTVTVGGEDVPPGSPRAAMRRGVAMVPADRAHRGILPTHSVRENLALTELGSLVRRGRISRSVETEEVTDWCGRVGLEPLEIERPVVEYSGGNQQKIVLAKWLRRSPRAIVLDEPTQGVDIGAKAAIYELIAKAAAAGAGIVVCSSDEEELVNISDRVLVICDGHITAELADANLTVDQTTAATLRPLGKEVA